jgi:hypothetical protein
MTQALTSPKITDPMKIQVLAMMVRGEKYKQIRKFLLDNYGVEYSNNALSMLRKRNPEVIAEIERTVVQAEASEAERIRAKSLRLLSRKLDQAAGDELELSAIDEEYRNGDMTLADYKRKKAGLLELSVKDVLQVTEKMHNQTKDGPGAVAPSGSVTPTAADARAAQTLAEAIKNGDTITINQIIVRLNNGAPLDAVSV